MKRINCSRYLVGFTMAMVWFFCGLGTAAAQKCDVAIKIATIAPEGSTWDRILQEFNAELMQKTDHRVGFKIYPGGVAGDEKAVLSKIRIGQLDGGGFTGNGMGEILPEIRILDLPFFVADQGEFDRIREGLAPYFKKKLAEKGYVLVGWMDLGSVYFYSASPIADLKALKSTKIWVWDGDSLAQYCWEKLGVDPVPLSVVDVMMGLQTGMVDTVYNTPLGAVSFQWYVKTRYHSTTPVGFFTATLIVKKNVFDKISKEDQKTLMDLAESHFKRLNQLVRKQNIEATRVMEARGVAPAEWSEQDVAELAAAANQVCKDLTGKQYSEELLKQAIELKKGAEPK